MNYKKISIITAISVVALFGGYKLYKKYISVNRSKMFPEDDEIPTPSSGNSVNPPKGTPSFDRLKIVKLGSKGAEAKTVQSALNNIINDAIKIKSTPKPIGWVAPSLNTYSTSNVLFNNDTTETEVNRIAKLTKLVVDGDFGSKSVMTLKSIMGVTSSNYDNVSKKRVEISMKNGLGNPY